MEQVQVGNILITDDRLAELDEGRIVLSVSRADFRGGDLVIGRLCKRPYLGSPRPGGIWLLWEAWRRGPMIVVRAVNGTVRLELKGSVGEQGSALMSLG